MSSFEFLRDFLSIFRGHPSLLHYNIFRKRALCSSNVMEEREKLRSNQRRSSSAENKIFFVGKKYVGYFSSGLVKGKFGMKLGLKLRRANLGLYHFESQWLFHGILLQISISNNNIMVLLIGVRWEREKSNVWTRIFWANIIIEMKTLLKVFFLQTEMNFLAYSC